MDEETIQRLTKEAVAQFLVNWEDTSETQVVECNGAHILVIRSEIRESHPLDFPFVAHINLEEKLEREIRFYSEQYDDIERFIQQHLLNLLTHMIPVGPSLLSFTSQLLSLAGHKKRLEAVTGSLSQEAHTELAKSAEEVTRLMLKKHNLANDIKPGRSRVLDGKEVLDALRKIGNPQALSIRRLARELNVPSATVRNWLRNKGFSSPQEFVDDLFGRLESEEIVRRIE